MTVVDTQTYVGYTLDQIKNIFYYDPDTGKFTSKVSGKEIVDKSFTYRNPKTGKVVCFNLSRVAMMLMTDDYLHPSDKVLCKDGDRYNLAYSNLSVVDHKGTYPKRNTDKNCYLETDEEHIFYGTLSRLFVVRRGPEQAVYRTYSKQKAVEVRDRWLESGMILHEWDDTMPVMFRN
jgi:hypothetical protein